jgi:murein DD-endopeptidase MepM/ murein hydrolase activator NlpD
MSALVVLGLTGVATAEPTDIESAPEPLPAAEELADNAVSAWDRLRDTLLPEPTDPALGRAIAIQIFQATAGVALPGVPLPTMVPSEIPDLETVPVRDGIMTSTYGHRRDPIHGRQKLHSGVDFSAKPGTPVYAAGTGVVSRAEWHRGYGRLVSIDHGAGFITRYAHLSTMLVKEGDQITAGMRIGAVGSSGRATGPHLHFELRVLGHAVDPLPALGIEKRRFSERLGDLLKLPFRERRAPKKRRRARRHRDRS